MPKSVFDSRALRNEKAAYAYVEAKIWPTGRVCPHCGVVDRSGELKGKSTRIGVYKCYACRKPFTVKVGTIFEDSHVPMHLWLQAIVMMCASKKGISSNQLHRVLGVTLRTAWHMSHRIRLAMDESGSGPLGGGGETVEVDETFWGQQGSIFINGKGWQQKRGWGDKMKVVTLVERKGRARSIKVDDLNAATVRGVVLDNADTKSALMTDEARYYRNIGKRFASHDSVNHSADEYVRTEDGRKITTNTVEGFFSIFKRGMVGIYQHCDERHLRRYLAEFDFRYSNRAALGVNDTDRAAQAVIGAVGKRLTYRTTRSKTAKAPSA